MISFAQDWFDMFATLGNGLFTPPHAELDIFDLDSAMRPQLFTFIDCNLIKEARKLLQANPSLVDEVEPETGWYPIHLAACEGRTEFLRMFISDFRANPNIRSKFSRSTPLHQAVIGKRVEAVKALLDLGAHVDTKLSANEGGLQYTALELAMIQIPGMRPSQDSMDVIRVLLQGGADYLRNFDGMLSTHSCSPEVGRSEHKLTNLGYPIIFSAAGRHIDLLKLFFDCIGPEDSRLVVDYRDSQKETMLHTAVMNARFDIVKLLLELGADPGSRDVNGQTAYVKLLTVTLAQGTGYIAPIQGLMALVNKKLLNLADANKVLALLEDIGGNASAVEDEYFTKEEVEKVHSDLKSAPRLGQVCNPIQIANAYFQISRYLDSNSPCVSNLRTLNGRHLLIKFASSLATWAANRKEGLVPLDSLPEGWSEFFDEANREMEGLLTSWMKKDEIPQLTKLVRDTTVSACEWVTSKEGPPGPQILVLVARIIHECIKTGAADVLEEHLASVLFIAWKTFQADFHASWRTKIFVLQRLRRIWRAINEGEVLDLLYDLAELLEIHEALDNLDDYTPFQPLRPGPQTPSWALDNLSLTQKYPKATVFVTTQQFLPPHTRIALFFTQLAIFVLPFLLFIVATALNGFSMRYNNSFIVIATHLVETVFPSGWVFLDGKGRPHPNILRGLQAAWELILFRARHWFWYSLVAQEPLILSINSKPANAVDIPSLLDCMKKNRLFPIYWLSLKPEDVATPVPCYAAMGEIMKKWKNGDLPRNAWGDGWWELREEDGHEWKRINVTERPTWGDYSDASKKIKVSELERNTFLLIFSFRSIFSKRTLIAVETSLGKRSRKRSYPISSYPRLLPQDTKSTTDRYEKALQR
jgi:ankyrin repeat protein